MKSLTTDTLTALAQPSVPLVQLVLLDFAAGAVALNTSTWDLVFDGVTYKGAYGLGAISAINDSPGEIKGLRLSLSGVSASAIALALDGGDVWQGTPVRIRTAILNAAHQITEAPLEWAGRGDVLSLSEDGDTCAISATAESTAVDLLRGAAMTYSDADQQALHPGDLALQYVVDQSDKPVIWPAKEYFYK